MPRPTQTGPRGDQGAETLLVGYLRKALASIDAGEKVVPIEICAEHPELALPLAEALGLRNGLVEIQKAAHATDPAEGKILNGRYRLDVRLGSGAMGVVYRATDLELKREVALKLLASRVIGDPVREQRFLREAEVLASLRHPHVVGIFDRGRAEDGSLFLVMELLEGASLAEVLASREDSPDEASSFPRIEQLLGGGSLPERSWMRNAVRWTAELATGLRVAHESGISHRDVKPSNVFIRRDSSAVLIDFGIAAREEDSRLTAAETTIGTPWYMAPEQATGQSSGDAIVDVYGLSATLYHLVTGRPPFEGIPSDVLVKLRSEDPVPANRLVPGLPRDLEAILEKGMERNPSRRYPNMAALEADLVAFLDHRPVSVRPLSALGRKWRKIRRAPAKSVAVAASVAVLLSMALLLPLWSSHSERARQTEKAELLAKLPVLIAIEGSPEQRPTVSLTDHEECDATLRRILELDPNDLPTRLIRAALLLDKKDHDGAAAELDEVARRSESAYLREVAARFAKANRAQHGTEAVDLDGLPEPSTDQDKFVAGFHELRNRHKPGFARRAETLLASCKDSYLPARDLRLVALLALGNEENVEEAWQQSYDESIALREVYGRETARTLAVRGAALIPLKRYHEAVEPLLASLELRPERHSPLQNLGVAYRNLGKLDLAVEYLDKAAKLRPEFWNTKHTMAQVLTDRGEYEKAYAIALELPESGAQGVAWKRPQLLGWIRRAEAISLHNRDEYERAREVALHAADHYAEAKERAGDPVIERRLETTRAHAVSIANRSLAEAVTSFLNLPASASPHEIARFAAMLPVKEGLGLSAEATWSLRNWLRKLAVSLPGADAEFKRQQLQEIERDLKERAASRRGERR